MNNLSVKIRKWLFVFVSIPALVYAQKSTKDDERKAIPNISSGKHIEFAPTISADGRIMIFESNKDKGWKLYESHLDNKGKWSEPFPLTAINEKLDFLAGPSLSYDGNTLFFTGYIENVSTSEDIFYSVRLDGKNWSEPKNLGAPINTDGYEGFSSISADGNSLYFIRMNEENPFDKKSKEACFKIFVSHKNENGSWGEPKPLPLPINSGCERDPKIMADNHTLILSSIRPEGQGKYDLYQTRKLNDDEWSELMPLDFVNSAENDQSPCIAAAGELIYFYSDEDIYSVPIPQEYRQMINVTVQGFVTNDKTNEPVQANIIVKSITTGKTFTSSNNPNDGQYSIVLSAGQQYSIEFLNDFYVPEIIEYDLKTQDKYMEVRKDVRLKSEYKIDLTIKDKDLNNNITAWLNIKDENGQTVLEDSVKKGQYPFNIILQAGKNYEFSVDASNYANFVLEWNIDALKIRHEMSHTIFLEHYKTELFTDVANLVTNQKIKAKVYFNNEDSDEVIIVDAGQTVSLRKGDRYQVTTSSDKGYLFSSATIVAGKSGEQSETGEKNLTLKVIPIEAGAQLTLDHISFELNSADLSPSSFATLNRVIELLQRNPNISVEISAHTDDIGEEVYNQRLSERRALAIVRHLSKNGVEIQRMRPQGHGESKPLVPNATDEHRAKNRRVELRILRAK